MWFRFLTGALALSMVATASGGCSSRSATPPRPDSDAGSSPVDAHLEARTPTVDASADTGSPPADAQPEARTDASSDGQRLLADAGAVGGFVGNGVPIDGVKIECTMNAAGDCVMPLTYETHGLSYAQAVAQMAKAGVTHIVVKVCDLTSNSNNNQCPSSATFGRNDRNAVIVDLLTAFANATDATTSSYIPGFTPHVYLWERWWLWNGSFGTRADDFGDDISSVVSAAYASQLTHVIDGVGVIETQLESSSDVLSQALMVAARINSDTTALVPGGWLTTHGLSFPGGANGTWFDAIDTQPTSGTFFASMSEQASHFTFVYKNFPLEENCTGAENDNTLCATGIVGTQVTAPGYSHDFVDCLSKSKVLSKASGDLGSFDCTTDSGKKAYMLTPNALGGLGLGALTSFIANDCGAHPDLTNVMFWGDSGDAFSEMSAGNVRVLHEIMVDDPWSVAPGGACGAGGFSVPQAMKVNKLSHFAFLPPTPDATATDPLKYILTVDGHDAVPNDAAASPADDSSYTTPMTVWQEWGSWPSRTPTACSATTPCY